MNYYLFAAGGISAYICLLHTFYGGKTVAKPLLKANDIQSTAKYTQYYCWHLVTFTLAMLAAGFIYAANWATNSDIAWFSTILASGFAIWGLVLPPLVKEKYSKMPQGWLFAPLIILGYLGSTT